MLYIFSGGNGANTALTYSEKSLYNLLHFRACLVWLANKIVLFLCSETWLTLLLCSLYVHIIPKELNADRALWRGCKKIFWHQECNPECLLVGSIPGLCFPTGSLTLLVLEFYVLNVSCSSIRIAGWSFIFVGKRDVISSVLVKRCGNNILGRGQKEFAHLFHHAKPVNQISI